MTKKVPTAGIAPFELTETSRRLGTTKGRLRRIPEVKWTERRDFVEEGGREHVLFPDTGALVETSKNIHLTVYKTLKKIKNAITIGFLKGAEKCASKAPTFKIEATKSSFVMMCMFYS